MKKHQIGTVTPSTYVPLVRVLDPAEGNDNDRHADRFARIAWSTITEPGDRVAGRIIQALGAVGALRQLLYGIGPGDDQIVDQDWADAVERWKPRAGAHLENALRAAREAAKFGMKYVVPADTQWPAQLDDLGDQRPHGLWVRGNVVALDVPVTKLVAIVGARAATGYGEHVTVELAGGLVDRRVGIVSGGAYGIDGTAHRAALASQGLTIAVLAGGLDRFYPSGHEALLTRVVDRGAVVSELPPGASPTRWRFLLRNRIIAALAGGTIVVEAGWRSGSLNTAMHARTLGRPVGAVPGPVTSASSAGCHRLIREEGATCVTNADEVAQLVDPEYVSTRADIKL
jgi:DNA processing protein